MSTDEARTNAQIAELDRELVAIIATGKPCIEEVRALRWRRRLLVRRLRWFKRQTSSLRR